MISRTPQNVPLVKEMLDETNTTRKRPVRDVQATLKQEHDIDSSRESVRRSLLRDLKLKFARNKRRQKLTKQHKENTVIYAKFLRKKIWFIPESKALQMG